MSGDRLQRRRVVAEAVGTALLVTGIVGSGIMGERLAGGNVAIALLSNVVATGSLLAVLIMTFGPVSGAHFNPTVSLVHALQGAMPWREACGFVAAQLVGSAAGLAAAHAMFDEPLVQVSSHARAGGGQLFSEFVATFGLLTAIWGCSRRRPEAVPFAVGLYITAACWFTASTSFANPAVTLARVFTNTFTGIRPADAPGFIVAQLAGALAATVLAGWLIPAAGRHPKSLVLQRSRGSA